jgi:hypothetical protein
MYIYIYIYIYICYILHYMYYLYMMEYYLALKKNEIMSFVGKWMELEIIMLN